ncbi:MAG TPA: LacI family DNA-binding transcriptional regulator [Salegentibacter sp.]|uniref:LacI family DNA-binding transcriptional regulator n=1 Tax=Salegentibacter sp. TaxID=1903072 RepID=UPI002F922739
MKRKKISMKDISKELGISITTISFIVNNKAENKISKEVIKKVEDYIQKVGYKPNSSAQSLRTGKSKSIVFMAEDISDPFFSAIAKQMEEIAFKNGYNIIYCSTENDRERTLELLTLFKGQVDAFIITPPENFENDLRKLIYEDQQTVMVFDRYFKNFKHNYVVLENFEGAQKAVTGFYESGRRNIAFVGIDSQLSPLVERHEGYLNMINKLQLPAYELFLKFDQVKTPTGMAAISNFLEENPNIDSILFATNNLAINGLRVIREKQIKIPEDLAIISFDERDVFELYSPPISVIAQPISELAKELINGTLEILASKKEKMHFFTKILPGELIVRDSLHKVKNLSSS